MEIHISNLRSRLLSFDATHVWIALILIALRPLLVSIPPEDFWWHMTMGRQIVQTGHIPAYDYFSFTQYCKPYYVQNWLAQVLLYGLHQLGRIELILLVQVIVIALAYGVLLWCAIKRSNHTRLSVGLLLLGVVPAVMDNWMVRPQSYALPLFAAFLFILSAYRFGWSQYRRILWLLPLLMVLWVNIHGSFILGLVLIFLTFIGEAISRVRRRDALSVSDLRLLALCGVVTALATLINPRGIEVIGYVRSLVGTPAVAQLVSEWASPLVTRSVSDIFFVAFALVALPVIIFSRKRPNLTDLLLLLPFLYLALSSGRHIIWSTMVALPPLAVALSAYIPVPALSKENPTLNGVVVGAVGVMLFFALPWIKPTLELPPEIGNLIEPRTPVRAVEALRKLPYARRPQRLYHNEGNGSYLIWAAPEQKVFIDPRFEFYPYQQYIDSMDMSGGKRINELLQKYRFDGMLLNNKQQKTLLQKMQQRSKQWHIVYQDEATTLFIRAKSPRID